MKKISVLIFTNLFPNPEQPLRGNFVSNLVQEMAREAEVTIVSPLPWFPSISLPHSLRNRFNWLTRVAQSWYEFSRVSYFTRWDEFEVYYPKYPFIPVLSRSIHPALMVISVLNLLKRLIEEKDIDIINAHWIYPDAIAAQWVGKRTGVPVVLTAHGCDINLYGKYKIRRPQIIWALRNSPKIITVSEALSQEIIDGFGIEKQKVTVIANGVDTLRFNIRNNKEDVKKRLGLNNKRRYLIFVGQLHEVKGINYLMEALYILQGRDALSFDTILIGDGPLKDETIRWLKEKRLAEKVFLKGSKPHKEIPLWMNAGDIFCLPSKREGQPCVILESLACGLPIIASRVGGIPELINKDNGILVESQDPVALADSIDLAFKRDWDREMISNQVKNLSWQRSANLYLKVFEEVLCGA